MFKLNIKAEQAFEWRNGLLMGQLFATATASYTNIK